MVWWNTSSMFSICTSVVSEQTPLSLTVYHAIELENVEFYDRYSRLACRACEAALEISWPSLLL